MRLEPTNIQQIGDELAIAWNDGTESFIKLETLRRACPCAACGGEPDAEIGDCCYLLLVMRSGHVHRVDAAGRKIAAENKRDAG